MKKRLLIIIMCMLLSVSAVVPTLFFISSSAEDEIELPFKDVRSSKWFYNAIAKMYVTGLMEGKSETKFDPNATMTRAELVTLMARIAGEETEGMAKFAERFPDVKKKAWYTEYVGWAAKTGLAQGYEGGLFKPNDPIKRLELAAFIIRLIDYMDLKLPDAPLVERFRDKVTFPSWAKDSIERMRQVGLIEGKNGGNFIAYASVTRAEVATIVSRFCDYLTLDPMHDAVKHISATLENQNGRGVIRLGDSSTVTAENLNLIIVCDGTSLDYEIYSVLFDEAQITALRNGPYADIPVGGKYDTELDVSLKNIQTGEKTAKVKVALRIIKVADLDSEVLPEFSYKIKTDGTAEIVRYSGVRYVKEVAIPSKLGGVAVTSIGKGAFKEARELVRVKIPDSVTFIDTEAFALCTALESVEIPDSVTKIGRAAFYYCTSLTGVTLPKKLLRIPDYMFYMCTALNTVKSSDTLEEIGKYAFSNCALMNFSFNEGLEIVGEYAFEGCALTKVYLPDSCTYAGHWAFYNCMWLEEASFGENLELIGSGILYNTLVKELRFRGSAEKYNSIYKLSAFSKEFPIVFEK